MEDLGKAKIFLTGGTGVLGSAVLELGVKEYGCEFMLALREKRGKPSIERFTDLLNYCSFSQSERAKVSFLECDLGSPDFGLGAEMASELRSSITHVIHCAGDVNLSRKKEDAILENTHITENISNFTTSLSSKGKLEFVSTVGVMGKKAGVLEETWQSMQREFHNSYEEAKARSEQIIQKKIEEGLKVTVHRPSMILGHADSGRTISFQVFYHLAEFLSGNRTWGFLPEIPAVKLDTVPVDYVSRVILWSALKSGLSANILHECSFREAYDLNHIRNLILPVFKEKNLLRFETRALPSKVFLCMKRYVTLFCSEKMARRLSSLDYFWEYRGGEQSFSNVATLNSISSSGIKIPSPSDYLEAQIRFYCDRKKN